MATELGTGLGMLGLPSIDDALESRTSVMRSLSPEEWDRLASLRAGGAYDAEFHAAWENGRAFLEARDGLRGRRPELVEWKGAVRAPGDEVAPIDLRIDHVYLVSCKYLSKILFNVSPAHLFDDLLVGGQNRRGRGVGGDWFAEVAPQAYQQLYTIVRRAVRDGDGPESSELGGRQGVGAGIRTGEAAGAQPFPGLEMGSGTGMEVAGGGGTIGADRAAAVLRELPAQVVDLTSTDRAALAEWLRSGWPDQAKAAYEELSEEVAQVTEARWRASLTSGSGAGEAMLWRLLRMGSTPYFVLGSSETRSLRLRIATPWDWRQVYALLQLEIFAQPGGQPRVGWTASVRQRASGELHQVSGHVEVRWSHGRFSGPPEAKGYLDTAHHLVPGYFPLR
jgi:hypothetical protein